MKNVNGLQEMVLIGEIVLQAKIAQRAYIRLQNSHLTSDQVETTSSIQSLQGATGNVSKILWPPRKHNKERGEHLRQLLKVDDNSILSNRKFRDNLEHYDERIEDFFTKQNPVVYIDNANNPSLSGFGGANVHRGYNWHDNTLVFRGELLDLNEIMQALEDIIKKCNIYMPFDRIYTS